MSRTDIIGDIHGCFDELLEKGGLRPDDLLVSVGDLVDRGPAPGEVLSFFRERPNSVVLMGNHEREHVRGFSSTPDATTRSRLEAVPWRGDAPPLPGQEMTTCGLGTCRLFGASMGADRLGR